MKIKEIGYGLLIVLFITMLYNCNDCEKCENEKEELNATIEGLRKEIGYLGSIKSNSDSLDRYKDSVVYWLTTNNSSEKIIQRLFKGIDRCIDNLKAIHADYKALKGADTTNYGDLFKKLEKSIDEYKRLWTTKQQFIIDKKKIELQFRNKYEGIIKGKDEEIENLNSLIITSDSIYKAQIAVLNQAITEKNSRITELEDDNAKLIGQLAKYQSIEIVNMSNLKPAQKKEKLKPNSKQFILTFDINWRENSLDKYRLYFKIWYPENKNYTNGNSSLHPKDSTKYRGYPKVFSCDTLVTRKAKDYAVKWERPEKYKQKLYLGHYKIEVYTDPYGVPIAAFNVSIDKRSYEDEF